MLNKFNFKLFQKKTRANQPCSKTRTKIPPNLHKLHHMLGLDANGPKRCRIRYERNIPPFTDIGTDLFKSPRPPADPPPTSSSPQP